MHRPALIVLAALALAAAAFWFFRSDTGQPASPTDSRGDSPVIPTPAAAGAAVAETGEQPADAGSSGRRDPAEPQLPTERLQITGRVLGDPRMPVAGAEVLAYRGQPDDRTFSPLAMMGQDPRRLGAGEDADLPFRLRGEVLARAAVAADGSFELTVPERHLRLALEHDFYGLMTPAIVHVRKDSIAARVVLEPYLGALLRGRALGADPSLVKKIRVGIRPNPLAMMRDPMAFSSMMLQASRDAGYTPATGEFVVRAALPEHATTVFAEGDEVAGRLEVPPMQPAETREVALPLLRAAGLTVRVHGEGDVAVAAARVELRPASAESLWDRIGNVVRKRTDAAGTAEFRGLLPGTWVVQIEADDWLDATREVTLPGTAELAIELARGKSVEGVVVDADGKPIAGARVAPMEILNVPMFGDMTDELGLDLMAMSSGNRRRTDAAGRFVIAGIPGDEPFQVIASHDDYAPGRTKGVRAGDRDVRIVLPAACTVVGRVVSDEDGRPLPAFEVELQATMFLTMRRPVRTAGVVESADGSFRLTGLPPGEFSLVATAPGRSDARTEVTLGAGATFDAGELRLPRGAVVQGTVRGENGEPVARALVKQSRGGLLDNPMLAMLQGGLPTAHSDERGVYVLRDLPPGRLQLVADAPGYASARSQRVTLAAGAEVQDVDITLDHGGSIEGVVRVAPGERPEDFIVIVQDQQTQKSQSLAPGSDGSFRFDNLDPGRYQAQAMHPAALSAIESTSNHDARPGRGNDMFGAIRKITENVVSQKVVVRAGETATVELDASELGSGVQLDLRVFVGDEALRQGVLEVTGIADGRVRMAFFDDGRATVGALQPGPVRVQVRAGMTLTPVGAPQDVMVPAGTDHHSATLRLPGGELRGRVVELGSGEPLRNVLVRLLPGDVADAEDMLGTAVTDGDGAFAFRALRPGKYGLVAADALVPRDRVGSASRLDGIEVGDAQVVEGILLRAQPAAGVTASVTDANGAPVGGAMVLAVDADGRPLGGFAVAVTSADGRAVLAGLPRGRTRLVARAAGLAPDATPVFEAVPDEMVEVALMLPRGTSVVLDAVSAQGLPLAGAEVSARCNDGPWFPALLLVESRSAGGRLDLGRLAPGDWEFRVGHPATGTFTVRRAIQDGTTVTILASPR